MPERYRRARTIALFWEAGRLAGGNYWTQSFEALEARDAALLDAVAEWTTAEELAARAPADLLGGDGARAAAELERLAGAGLVVRESAAGADGEADAARFAEHWREWGVATQIFHATSKDAPYTETNEEAQIVYREMVGQAAAPPPAVKRYPGAPRLELPRDGLPPLDVPLETVLASRRTWRAFTGAQVSLGRFAKIMMVSFGAVCEVDAGEYGRLLFKTSPSGGARHPTEAYVVSLAVEGVPRGIWHYDPLGHALERLAEGDFREDAIAWLTNQYWFRGSSFVVFLTAIPARLWYKYKHGRTYRVMLLDQGHLGQTFALAATALGLGAWQTAALKDTAVERALGLDGIEETVLYALGAGVTPVPALYPGKHVELWAGPPKRIELPPP